MCKIGRLGPRRFKCLRHLPAFRIGHDGNSLPVAGKSTRMAENAATGLIPLCTENLIRVDAVMESPKLAE
jgi:hypothetical protein